MAIHLQKLNKYIILLVKFLSVKMIYRLLVYILFKL